MTPEKTRMPLEGIRVLEYGIFHAGPGAGAILGDLGAEVIKIEENFGDPERFWTEVGGMDFSLPGGDSLMFHISNRNKKSIHLDIRRHEGRRIFARLIKTSDVFITNLRKSTKIDMGIDYPTLSKLNPHLIQASVSGYGPEGPVCDLGAYDPLGQARSGMMFATGSEEPVLINLAVLDQATAIAASHAILPALFVRERSGQAQEVHISLYSTALWLLYTNVLMNSVLSLDPGIRWDRSQHSPLRNVFCCKDGKWIVGTLHPEQKYWPAFCEATGQISLLNDPRYAEEHIRRQHNPELMIIFDRVFTTRTRDEWMDIFHSHKLLFAPVQRIHEVLDDPQSLINNYVVDFDDKVLGKLKIPGYPFHFSSYRAGTRSFGPALGEHTESIMRQMGYTDEEVELLKKEGVIR